MGVIFLVQGACSLRTLPIPNPDSETHLPHKQVLCLHQEFMQYRVSRKGGHQPVRTGGIGSLSSMC